MVRRIDEEKRFAVIFEWLDGGEFETIAYNHQIGRTTAWDIIQKAEKACPSLEHLRSINMTIRDRGISPETALASASYVSRALQLKIRPEALSEYIGFLESLSGDKDPLFKAAKDLVNLKNASGKSYDQLASEYRQLKKDVSDLRTTEQDLIPLRKEYDEKSETLTKAKYALDTWKVETIEKQKEVDTLLSEIKVLSPQITVTRNLVSTNEKRLEEISSQIKDKEAVLVTTEDEIKQKEEAFAIEVKKHEAWIAEKKKSEKQMKEALRAKQSEIEAADKKMQELDNKLKDLSESIGKKKPLIPLISILESPNIVLDKTTLLEAVLAFSEGLKEHAPTYRSQYHSDEIDRVAKTLYYDRQMLMEVLRRDRPGSN